MDQWGREFAHGGDRHVVRPENKQSSINVLRAEMQADPTDVLRLRRWLMLALLIAFPYASTGVNVRIRLT
jgi:hypothetical protein